MEKQCCPNIHHECITCRSCMNTRIKCKNCIICSKCPDCKNGECEYCKINNDIKKNGK